MMNDKFNRTLKWFSAPDDIGFFSALCWFCVGVILLCTMSALYYGVVIDNNTLKENFMYQMINDIDAFMDDLHANPRSLNPTTNPIGCYRIRSSDKTHSGSGLWIH